MPTARREPNSGHRSPETSTLNRPMEEESIAMKDRALIAPEQAEIEAGYYLDMDDATYRGLDCAHYSTLKLLPEGKALEHVREAMLHPKPSTPDMEIGSAFHVALLEEEAFPERYHVIPADMRRDKRTKAYQEQVAIANGRHILTLAEAMQIGAMVEKVKSHKRYGQLLDRDYEFESCAVAQLDAVGPALKVWAKCKLDYYAQDIGTVLDPKTCQDASKEAFARTCAQRGYHIQATLYTIIMEALGKPVNHWVWLAIEKEPPYSCAFWRCPDHIIDQTRPAVWDALERMAAAYALLRWPGYSEDIEDLDMPTWAMNQLTEGVM